MWSLRLFLLVAFGALHADGLLGSVNGTDCTMTATANPSRCPLRGAQMLTIVAATSVFGSDASANAVTLTRPAGIPRISQYDEPSCITSTCRTCTSGGTTMQCWLIVPNGQNISGNWTMEVFSSSGTSQGTILVALKDAIPPVISGTDGCPDYNGRRALNCVNGQLITIEGSNFDYEVSSQNVVVFAKSTYPGAYSGNIFPLCYNVNSQTPNRIFCNLTYPPGSRGEFAIQITTQGTASTYYPYAESTVSVKNLTLTPTPTQTATVTLSASSTTTHSETATATATRTASRTRTASITRSTTLTSTATPTATATGTTTRSATATASDTGTRSATATATATTSRTSTATPTSSRSATLTASSTSTATATRTASATPTATGSDTSTRSTSMTSTMSGTQSMSDSSSATSTRTRSTTITKSGTSTPTRTSTATVVPTTTPTATATTTDTSTSSASRTFSTTITHSETTIPHFSGDAIITFNFQVDDWTDDQRIEFQQAVATFFDQYVHWNAVSAPHAGPSNIEIMKIRMAEDSLGHRVPTLSVVHWRIVHIGYGYLHKSAEELMVEAVTSQYVTYLYRLLQNAYLDAVDGSFTRPQVPNVPQCTLCTGNPAYTRPYDVRFPPSPYKCTYTYNSETSAVQADALYPPFCDPANNNYKVGPVGSNIFAS